MSTIKEVAKEAGVSTATVSHVINGTRYVSPKITEHVKSAMDKLDYVPNISAYTLRTKRTMSIGLLIPLLVNETDCIYFSQIARGVESVLKKNGYNTILSNTNDNTTREIEEIKNAKNRMVDGMIITPTEENHEFIKTMNIKSPIVFIDRSAPNLSQYNSVISDTLGGCKDAIGKLIDLGHKNIGLVLSPKFTPDERISGYMQALSEYGITYDERLVRKGRNTFEEGYRLGKSLIEGNKDITAIFLATNLMAQGVMRYIQDNHINIPKDLSILVFDDYEWSQLHYPPLTTIRQDAYGLGERAAEIILEEIEGSADKKKDAQAKEVRLPLSLMIRDSWAVHK